MTVTSDWNLLAMAQSTYLELSTKFWRISCPAKGTRVTSTVRPRATCTRVCQLFRKSKRPTLEKNTARMRLSAMPLWCQLVHCIGMKHRLHSTFDALVRTVYFFRAVREDRRRRDQHGQGLPRPCVGDGIHRQASEYPSVSLAC